MKQNKREVRKNRRGKNIKNKIQNFIAKLIYNTIIIVVIIAGVMALACTLGLIVNTMVSNKYYTICMLIVLSFISLKYIKSIMK